MKKRDEISDPNSCLSRARDDEWVFTLLERDITSPDVVRYWVMKRILAKKNKMGDPQIAEALQWADRVEKIHRGKTS